MMIRGIDVSRFQGQIDWETVKASGVGFAIIRVGFGGNLIDDCFVRNISECNRIGLPCGVFWFSYAYTPEMAVKEAEYCLAAIKPYRVEYPVCFDFEYDSANYAERHGVKVTKSLVSAIANAFLLTVEDAGYFAMNYTNLDYYKHFYTDAVNRRFGLWLAGCADLENPPLSCYIAQYKDPVDNIPGIHGIVDIDASFIDFPKFLRDHGCNHLNDTWYTEAVEWAVKNGLSDGENPEEPISRAEMLVALKRFADYLKK